jgi:hypothetical protein
VIGFPSGALEIVQGQVELTIMRFWPAAVLDAVLDTAVS